jgi:serine/threonine protein kinase
MAAPSVQQFLQTIGELQLLSSPQTTEVDQVLRTQFGEPKALAQELLGRGWLTPFQVNLLLQSRGSQLLLGPYVLLDRLGEGGTGQVFKARHRRMNRLVAIKVIRKELMEDAEVVRRFYREIEVISRLSHPNIVHAFDAGPIGSVHTLVMEYVEGSDLYRVVQRSGPLSADRACAFIQQAALGLQHAHERNLVHRDIKPSNLLVASVRSSQDGTPQDPGATELMAEPCVKILDLGLARLQRNADGNMTTPVTIDRSVTRGTPDYLAPEQALDFHEVDIRADIYSLGCTLFYLLTGQPLFPGGSLAQKILRHQQAQPPALAGLRPGLPPSLEPILGRMLAKRPEDRYQTPAEVAVALGAVTGVSPALTEGLSATVVDEPNDTVRHIVPPGRDGQRKRLLWLAAGVGGAVLLLALLVGVLLLRGLSSASSSRPVASTREEPPRKREEPITTNKKPSDKVTFSERFPQGKASPNWILTPPTGYWSMEEGRLVASGPTVFRPGQADPNQKAYIQLPAETVSFQVDIEISAGVGGISFWEPTGKRGIAFVAEPAGDKDNVVEWGVWDRDPPGKWDGWRPAGSVTRGTPHTFLIVLEKDGTFTLQVDGKARASGVRVGAASEWNQGIQHVALITSAGTLGTVLNTRFSNVQALRR